MLAAGALDRMTEVIAGLEVDIERMSANLNRTNGLIMAEAVAMALGTTIGKLEAHYVIAQACQRAIRESRHLHDVLVEDPLIQARFTVPELEKLMDPANYLGATQEFIDRVLFAAGADRK